MKRFAVVAFIVSLLVMFFPNLLILAQPLLTPHENPAVATSQPNPTVLLFSYGNAFNLASLRQYQDARRLFNEIGQANIPDDLRYLADRYHALSQQLFTTLEYLEALLDEVEILLAENQLSAAQNKLESAEATIQDVQFLLAEITAATNNLADNLAILLFPITSQIRQAYDRLEESLNRLKSLLDERIQLQRSMMAKQREKEAKLTVTELSLNVTPTSVFIGDSIVASGKLTGGGKPLAGRKLELLLEAQRLITLTSFDGSYTAGITVPYQYVNTMNVTALFIPSGTDIDTYLASQSPPVLIKTRFYPTFLEVSALPDVYPGLPSVIYGRVSSADGGIARTIEVFLDNTQLAQQTAEAQFSLEITLPPQISTGKLRLDVTAIPYERYAGTTAKLDLNISRIPVEADIRTPPLLVTPKTIEISGKVSANLTPIQDAQVALAFKQSSAKTKTAMDGSFTAAIKAPLDLSLIGPQELTIVISPVEPWYASPEIKRWVFTINPSNLGLIVIAFFSLGWLLYHTVRTKPLPREEEKLIFPLPVPKLPPVTPPPIPHYEFTGTKGRILSAYLNGVEAVEKKTGIPMNPETTLREFLNTTISRAPTLIRPFTELTIIAEIALYSAHKLSEDIATYAEQLAALLKEELRHGTA